MRTMIFAFVFTAVMTVGADFFLDMIGFSAEEQTSGNAVRLD